MVVCKFFQQGNCRYGQSCRFEHVYGSKYTYHAPQHAVAAAPTGMSDEQLLTHVAADVKAILNGGQWLLTCYAPFKERPSFPGFTDLSFEEARLFVYEAKASNNIGVAVSYMNNLFKEAREKYERLLQPTHQIIKTLRALYNGEVVASPFTQTQTTASAASVFRSAAQSAPTFGQNNAASIFGQKAQSVFGATTPNTNSVFGGPTSSDNSKSVFATSTDTAKSIFAQATQNTFPSTQNVFGPQSPTSPQSIFAQANQNQHPFTSPQQTSNPTNIFASASQQFFGQSTEPLRQNQQDVFAQKQNPFVQNTTLSNPFQTSQQSNAFGDQMVDDSGIYSKMEDLTPKELEEFNNADFRLGFIPELPPPRALCI